MRVRNGNTIGIDSIQLTEENFMVYFHFTQYCLYYFQFHAVLSLLNRGNRDADSDNSTGPTCSKRTLTGSFQILVLSDQGENIAVYCNS